MPFQWELLAQAMPAMPPPGLKPDGVLAFVLLDIAIILVAARLFGALARKVGQPGVVGEIVAGVMLGPTLLGPKVFAWNSPWEYLQCGQSLTVAGAPPPSISACLFPPQARSVLGMLGQIALVLFMFLVGLELDWDTLKGKGKAIFTVAVGSVAVPIGLAFLVAPALYNGKFVGAFGTDAQASKISFTLFIGAMLSVTAFPVMARILQEKGLTQSPMGAVGVAAAAVVTVLMFLAVAVAAGVASEQGPSSLATKFVVAGVYIAILFLVVKRLLAPLGRAYEARGTLTPTIFAVIMIVLFASAYTAHKIGINVIVGGFLAGSILPARQALFRDMAGRLADFTAIILLPIFLAFSGLNTDFTTLGVSFMGGIAIFLLAGIVGKWLGGAVFARLGGLSWAEGNVLGILMNCRGLLVLVVGLIGFSQGVISGPMQVGGVVMALVTTMMTGPLFDAFMPRVRGAAPAGTGPATSPDATGALRVLAVLDDPDRAPAVAHAAFTVVGGQRPAEVVLCRLFPLPLHGGILSGINDEALEAERSLRALRIVGSLGPPGVVVSLLARSSVDEAADYAHLAEERGCDLAVVDGEARLGGGPAERELSRLLTLTAADVVVYHHGTDGTPALATDAPVTVFAGEADPVALRLGEQVAASLGRPLVPALADPDDVALAEAGRRSAALVVAGRPDLLRGAVVAACPLYVVHARRPAVAAAPAQG